MGTWHFVRCQDSRVQLLWAAIASMIIIWDMVTIPLLESGDSGFSITTRLDATCHHYTYKVLFLFFYY